MEIKATMELGAAGAGVIGVAYGFLRQFSKERARIEKQTAHDSHSIIDVKNDLIKVLQDSRDSWREKFEEEHNEFVAYRQNSHAQINEAQGKLLQYSAEVSELRAKTDLSPILDYHKEQSQINQKVLATLDKLSTTLDRIIQRLDDLHIKHKATRPHPSIVPDPRKKQKHE